MHLIKLFQPQSSLRYTKQAIPRSYDEWANLEKEIENESDVCTESTSSKAKIHSNKMDVGKILEKEDIHNLKNSENRFSRKCNSFQIKYLFTTLIANYFFILLYKN